MSDFWPAASIERSRFTSRSSVSRVFSAGCEKPNDVAH